MKQEAERLRAEALRLQNEEEDLGERADLLDEEAYDIRQDMIPSIESDIQQTQQQLIEKDIEVEEEEQNIEIHRQAAKRWRDKEREKREEARKKIKEGELLCSQADAECVRGLPQRAMGNFAVATPILERARDLQLQGQQAERGAEEFLRIADECERKFDLILDRAVWLAQERQRLLAHLRQLKQQSERQKRDLKQNQREAEGKRNECLRLRDEEYRIGMEASELEDQAEQTEKQASEAETKANRILQQLG